MVSRKPDEFQRLKHRERESLHVSALSDAKLAAIATAEVPGEYAELDGELKR